TFRRPRRGLNQQNVTLHYLGQTERPYSSEAIRGNRFDVTLRDLAADTAERVVHAADEIRRDGLANYFDDQRFGSVGPDGVFIGKQMVLGRYEDALKLALTAPYEFDLAAERRTKAVLIDCWGRWAECQGRLPPG